MNDPTPVALFRFSVLGPLVSRAQLARGELKALLKELASREYAIPGTRRRSLSEKTIEAWYYAWRRGGIQALEPKARRDKGQSKLPAELQQALLRAKRETPRRSIDQLIELMEYSGRVAQGRLPRSSVHRLLQRHGLSRPLGASSLPEEHRRFEAAFAGEIWYGDVMHGPRVPHQGKLRKTYLVSLMDDASRLLAHSAFCLGEKAVDIEGVLKQAALRRGLPAKLVVDNGPAYRSQSLQAICARLDIHLIYCRPFAPEGKGKLERWHRTLRGQFLAELDPSRIADLADLNARLWAWIEQLYHRRVHGSLHGLSPLARYQQDLARIRTLGERASRLDEIFYHRLSRKVRRDATLSYEGKLYEVPYELSGRTLQLVVDPHSGRALSVEDEAGNPLGAVTPLDLLANCHRRRRKPPSATDTPLAPPANENLVELAYRQYHHPETLTQPTEEA